MNARTIAVCGTLMLLTACGGPRRSRWHNPNHPEYEQADFDRDWYQCERENRSRGLETIYKFDHTMVKHCMAARGWQPAKE